MSQNTAQTTPPQGRIPAGHHAVNGFIVMDGAQEFIAFLREVFGAVEREEVRSPDRDGRLIHAEVRIGDATIMLADTKPDWPALPALTQVYVADAQATLDRAVAHGGKVITEPTPFYNNVKLARFFDPWHNLWWLFEPTTQSPAPAPKANTDWQSKPPSKVYTTLLEAMATLRVLLQRTG